MEAKNRLEVIREYVNKEFTSTPSPFMKWLKPIVLSVEQGTLSFQYTIRKEMTNPIGTLHGGVTAAIIDDVIGATMYSFNEDGFYTTVNNVIDYFASAREGDTIIANTSIIKKGRQMVNAQCEVWNADKTRLIARGYSNLLKIDPKKENT
jgi:acyl-coenzyme A thioesterase 13